MNDPIDKTLEDYLSGNSQVSQRYRELDAAAVPPQLDQSVLARARAAVGQSSHADELERVRRRRKRLVQWSIPAGLAASAVLVVSIVMQSGMQHEVSMSRQPASAPAAVRERSDRSADAAAGLVEPRQPQAPLPPPMAPAAKTADDAIPPRVEMQAIESSAKRQRELPQDSPPAVKATRQSTNETAFASPIAAPAPLASVNENAPSGAAQPVSGERFSEGRRDTSAQAIGTAVNQSTATRQAAETRDTAHAAAASVMTAGKEEAESRRAEPAADSNLSEIAVTGNRVSRTAPTLSGPRNTVPQRASTVSQPDAAGAAVQEAPPQWLERIRQLRKDGKPKDADREWQRFREMYPDYAVADADVARPKQ